jgi:predicted phosphatase
LAIGIEALVIIAGVNDHFTILAAIRAFDVCKFFHGAIYTPVWRKCKWLWKKVVPARDLQDVVCR